MKTERVWQNSAASGVLAAPVPRPGDVSWVWDAPRPGLLWSRFFESGFSSVGALRVRGSPSLGMLLGWGRLESRVFQVLRVLSVPVRGAPGAECALLAALGVQAPVAGRPALGFRGAAGWSREPRGPRRLRRGEARLGPRSWRAAPGARRGRAGAAPTHPGRSGQLASEPRSLSLD